MGKAIVKKSWEQQLRQMVAIIKEGGKVWKFTDKKPVLDGTMLKLAWKPTTETIESKDALALLWDVVPYAEQCEPGAIMAISSTSNDGKPCVKVYYEPRKSDPSSGKVGIADAVAWINAGKPCAARCGFSWKGARGGRISLGYAIDKLMSRDYHELCIERGFGDDHIDVLMFQSYSGSDWD